MMADEITSALEPPCQFMSTASSNSERCPPTGIDMARNPPSVRMLDASVDPEHESEFRFLVDEKLIKYVTIDGGVYDVDEMCFEPALLPMLPQFPPGDWNQGHIARDPATEKARFASVTKGDLPGITETWHPVFVDHLELQRGERLRAMVYEATCPRFDSTVAVKYARFPWEIGYLDKETAAYALLDGHGIGPPFLAHLTEEGRVIGFVMGLVADFRHATPDDFRPCHDALARLHGLGFTHGDINKHNFLVHDGKATLIDFESLSRAGASEREEELRRLMDELLDTSGRGGFVDEVQGESEP